MILSAVIILLALLIVMVRMNYVLIRDREDSFKWRRSLELAIYDAGWIKEYKRACQTASEKNNSSR